MKNIILSIVLLFHVTLSIAQVSVNKNIEVAKKSQYGCGSQNYLEYLERKTTGTINLSDKLIQNIGKITTNKNLSDEIFVIPVVFHVVYNDEEDNVPDSVLHNQIETLNNAFRRTNADTIDTRTEFLDIVGDTKIEFELASTDPNGNATSGITRTQTSIEHFGGVMPYSFNQSQEIFDWYADSLMLNYARITNDNLGGKSAWNVDKYLNVWIGDLRITEPMLNSFEVVSILGLATPPIDHENWPDTILQALNAVEQGTIIHFASIGPNNPSLFSDPFSSLNNSVKDGKVLVHEVGHYLGLRHIWGDGDCNMDDFIHDTPRSNFANNFACISSENSCVDTINGIDLPNMFENYMDYTNGNCQNSFTIEQGEVMRTVLETYRSELAITSTIENTIENNVKVYPNPTVGSINIEVGTNFRGTQINVRNLLGQLIEVFPFNNINTSINLTGEKGIYFVEVISEDENKKAVFKIIKTNL